MITTLYGIRNCDTIKKTRLWLDAAGIDHKFHDYKVAGVDKNALDRWVDHLGWNVLLNRSGTTFRKLAEHQKADLDREGATALMIAQPSMIKRPVLERGGDLLVGFDTARYAVLFG